jgi:integrase/recombinase XerD
MTDEETSAQTTIGTGIQPIATGMLTPNASARIPAIIVAAGPAATRRYIEFFTVTIRNPNTRAAYHRAVTAFLAFCEGFGLSLERVEPVIVAVYVEGLTRERAAQTAKQNLAAIRMFFDWLVVGQVLPTNPATSVRGPRYSYERGKTPVLSASDTRKLLDSIDTSHVVGLRDRALIGLMVYSFARVGAVTKMRVGDYYPNGKTWWIRLHEKGGKLHEVPVHHNAEAYIDAYLAAAGIAEDKKLPLFRSIRGRTKTLTGNAIHPTNVLLMIKRRAKGIGLPDNICCHTFRATGITTFLENGGSIEHAQTIAAHESPRTTKLYDRRNDQISLDEIERIII